MESKFEKASRLKLRFNSEKVGFITVEDLWDLSLKLLNVIAKKLKKELDSSQEEDFLEESSKEDVRIRLSFDIVLYVLNTKKDEAKRRKEAGDKKVEKERLLDILDKKKVESDELLSEKELEDKIKALDN